MGELEQHDGDSLRDVVRALTTPARAGVFLTQRDLERVGAAIGIHGLPQGRRFALEQLFRTAALDERLPDLFAALSAEIEDHRRAYRAADPVRLQQWDSLAAQTLGWLAAMEAESAG